MGGGTLATTPWQFCGDCRPDPPLLCATVFLDTQSQSGDRNFLTKHPYRLTDAANAFIPESKVNGGA